MKSIAELNAARLHRFELLRAFRQGDLSIADVLADPAVRRMNIERLLEYAPIRRWNGRGEVPHGARQFARRVMSDVDCSPWREVAQLTARQIDLVVSAVCEHLPDSAHHDRRPRAIMPRSPSAARGSHLNATDGSHTWSHP